MRNTYVAIMAGGIGSRFWPKSRTDYPKQFIDILNSGQTLIQITFERFAKICPKENIFVVTNEQYASIVKEQLPDIPEENILKEPSRRNTAPCVAYVSYKLRKLNPEANLIVTPSDHLIFNESVFYEVIEAAINFCKDRNALVTLGIKPTRPDTGYGYVQFFQEQADSPGVYKVKTFTEKPNKEIAETFLLSGDFLWNSGMFVWNVGSIIEAFEKHLPEIADAFAEGEKYYGTKDEDSFISRAYSLCTNISIDYGIMEKANNVFVIPSTFGWSDVGAWGALHEIYKKDDHGNAVKGDMVKVYDASNNMIMVPDGKMVVVQGLEDYCIIDTGDVLLLWQKSKEQDIKQITSDIKRNKLDQFL
ncbi:MAG: mannose-1-phosphate guanylyltransferase [Chitinophagales bacterium]|nr:mannose-1-phosphate guanylyltransferase [Chitinophagales bacterium]